jgi:UDP-glucose 4-epimerase
MEEPYFIEEMLKDLSNSDPEWKVCILRYFNPIGAHPSGKIGEDPSGIPNNLIPFITQVAIGRQPFLKIFGNDYPTKDGTGIRDYIHVVDLAKGHISAVNYIYTKKPRCSILNLGTGVGYSVLEILKAMERAVGKEIPYQILPRRPGDVTIYLSSPKRAKEEMGWTALYDLDKMCQDAWNWQKQNPHGYAETQKE